MYQHRLHGWYLQRLDKPISAFVVQIWWPSWNTMIAQTLRAIVPWACHLQLGKIGMKGSEFEDLGQAFVRLYIQADVIQHTNDITRLDQTLTPVAVQVCRDITASFLPGYEVWKYPLERVELIWRKMCRTLRESYMALGDERIVNSYNAAMLAYDDYKLVKAQPSDWTIVIQLSRTGLQDGDFKNVHSIVSIEVAERSVHTRTPPSNLDLSYK